MEVQKKIEVRILKNTCEEKRTKVKKDNKLEKW